MTWGDFCPEYKELEQLRYILPCYVPFMLASATLTTDNLTQVKRLLHVRSEKLLTVQTSVDCANIKLCVCKIEHSLSSYQDLSFLIPDGWKDNNPPPPKFLIFFDDIQDSTSAAKTLQKRVPPALQHKIKWFNSDMTTKFKEDELNHLVSGDTWGLCTTESFGMVIAYLVPVHYCSSFWLFREWMYLMYCLSSSGKPHASCLLYGNDGGVLSEIANFKALQYYLLKRIILMMCGKKGTGGNRQRNAKLTKTGNIRPQGGAGRMEYMSGKMVFQMMMVMVTESRQVNRSYMSSYGQSRKKKPVGVRGRKRN
jgi:hypothetical protein